MCAPGRLPICAPNPTASSGACKALYQIKAAGHNRKTNSTQPQRACRASRAVAAEIKGASFMASPSRGPKSRNCQNPSLCSDAIPGMLLRDVLLCTSTHPTLLTKTPPKESHQLIYAVTLLRVSWDPVFLAQSSATELKISCGQCCVPHQSTTNLCI